MMTTTARIYLKTIMLMIIVVIRVAIVISNRPQHQPLLLGSTTPSSDCELGKISSVVFGAK